MPNYNFKIGDRVRVRDFWEMYADFGCDDEGDIPLPEESCFTQEMRCFCGRETTIVDIYDDFIELHDKNLANWTITPSMLQPVDVSE